MHPSTPKKALSRWIPAAALGSLILTTHAGAAAASDFTVFETGQVRPLALSPDGKTLFAVNTPDNRLEIFRVKAAGLKHLGSVPVGLEPVAVAARNNGEVWVVNHLSDSVSIVDITSDGAGHVVRTLLVGDEPRDIVFAGPGASRAFITAAHRGQNSPIDPQLTTPGVGRADVWVFDADDLGTSLGGSPLSILTLFSDTPRALAVTPDGSHVYAAAFHSGNRTTTIAAGLVPMPPPTTDFLGVPQPARSLIVKFDGAHWVDELDRTWDHLVRFSLPDKDVFVIDATANPPAQLVGPAGSFSGVGTILFNMIVNPANGNVYVTNTEAINERRFEGPGDFAGQSVRGHLHESRITVLGSGGVAPRHLNKHIDYSTCCAPIPNDENERSLAFPQGMAITPDGSTLYVAALGSSKIGVFSTAEIEQDTFVPDTARQIAVSGGGPTGVILNPAKRHLYALTRFDNSISVIDTVQQAEVAHVPMWSPEPPSVVAGRRFLYDASLSSSHGDSACASCHVFGDFDSLAWDLGAPDSTTLNNPGPFVTDPVNDPSFIALKGPMTTQSLRGMANHGPMHWRGDRTGGNDAPSAQPDSGTFDEEAAFMKFLVAFPSLLGRSEPIPPADMQAFTDFVLQIVYPPNPIRALDNSLTPDQQAGRDFYFNEISFPSDPLTCNDCHVLDPSGNPGSDAPGFFGTDGRSGIAGNGDMLKNPHLRNQYQKVGAFGGTDMSAFFPDVAFPFLGDQVRGYGFLHDGTIDTLFRFVSLGFVFPPGQAGITAKRQVEDFMLAFDTNLAPIVGQQVTLTATNAAVAGPRVDLLISRADAGECDLVAKSSLLQAQIGFLYTGGGTFMGDRQSLPPIPDAALRQLPALYGRALTYTCMPVGSGFRTGVDRDRDGILDGDDDTHG
ncbi:YncE family protein [Sorangium sp. So ce341]|uniref:YncE family protein n=1 Tax=Sorangium sp. So ce341 TaxID=3133302 RepID=UPI003F61E79D